MSVDRNLDGYQPQVINKTYFKKKNINVELSPSDLKRLGRASREYKILSNRIRGKDPKCKTNQISLDYPPDRHLNTDLCPKNIIELNPVCGSCHPSCLYCLTNDGLHNRPVSIFSNYPEYVRKILSENTKKDMLFYLSGKTEVLQKPLIENGVIHKILLEFERHYLDKLDSGERLFIVTKMGIREATYPFNGESVIDILERIKPFVQLNGSISIFPSDIRLILEPNAPPVGERLSLISECHKRGIDAPGILMQPLLEPFFSEKELRSYLKNFRGHGVKHIKAEFLTLTIKNMAGLFPLLGFINPEWERELFENRLYSENLITKKGRISPKPQYAKEKYQFIKDVAEEYGITVSLCAWVRQETGMLDFNKEAEENGFLCMGQRIRKGF